MSVVTSLTAIPNRMLIVWRYLLNVGGSGVEETELRRLLRPASHQGRLAENREDRSDPMLSGVLSEMRALGLIERDESGKVSLGATSPNGDDGTFLEFVEKRLLHPEVAEKHGQAKVPGALAWFLVQDPARPLTWSQNYRAEVEADCGPDTGAFDLTDVARFEQFVYWARYLGFAWRLETREANVVFPDPTVALARHLPKVIGGKGATPIQDVMTKLAERLPVIEGGAARLAVESQLPLNKRRPDGQLSRSTSLAMERLELLGRLVLERPADAPAVNLDRSSGPRAVSHLTWRDGG